MPCFVLTSRLSDHASTVWNPALCRRSSLGCKSSVDKIESVQRLFTHQLFSRCGLAIGSSYTERLDILSLEPLQLRRFKADLCMLYKMRHCLVHVSCDLGDLFSSADLRTRGHSCRLRSQYCRSDTRLNFFATGVVPIWNNLPESVATSPSYPSFKTRVSSCYDILISYCTFARNL